MPLAPGTRLGPYEILALLGAGGMGEVYRARDTRLGRTVAVKILPPAVGADAERRARLEREARTVAALNHPHICTLHDVGRQNGTTFLVMEHLVGDTLAKRLQQGPVSLPDVLDIGTQIADALAAAHRHGIVHRDLKPANVMLVRTGAARHGAPQAKLLDFGLAKLQEAGRGPAVASGSATSTAPPTSDGVIVGTLPYMAPEQLEGRETDPRTDVWALGTILYEMITGRRAFDGQSQASLIASILEHDPPPLAAEQPLTPPALERLVRKCLAKHADDRWDGAHDVADELRWIGHATPATNAGVPAARRPAWRRALPGVAVVLGAAGVGTALGGWLGGLWRPATSPAPLVRSLLDVRPADELNAGGVPSAWLPTPGGSRTALTWAQDGRSLLFVGRRNGVQQLYVRALDRDQARPLAGTEDAQVPVVSADGRWGAFWAEGAIRRVSLGGGPVSLVVEGVPSAPWGMDWGAGGQLLYGQGGRIWLAEGGSPATQVTSGPADEAHGLPHWLPGGEAFVHTVDTDGPTWGGEQLVAHDVASGKRTILIRNATDGRYIRSGHLLFLRMGTLFAVAFDVATLEVRSEPVALLSGVAQALSGARSANVTGAGQFSVTPAGHLAYVAGEVIEYADERLVSVDRHGRVTALPAPARSYGPVIRIAPNGRQLAVDVNRLTERSVWVSDLVRGTLTKLTTGGSGYWPVWTPDGQRVTFAWFHDGVSQTGVQPVDGRGGPEPILDGGTHACWTPDGRDLLVLRNEDIWALTPKNGDGSLRPVVQTPARDSGPAISPDGRWLAFESLVSGQSEVYVQPYPGPGPRVQVSIAGGVSPAWHRGGHELFFVDPGRDDRSRAMLAVTVQSGTTPEFGRPRVLFPLSPDLSTVCYPLRCYDVAPDGSGFFFVQDVPAARTPPTTHIALLQNWVTELAAKVPDGTRSK